MVDSHNQGVGGAWKVTVTILERTINLYLGLWKYRHSTLPPTLFQPSFRIGLAL
jgi:hypothetical protein